MYTVSGTAMRKEIRLAFLLAILVGLLIYTWATDHPTPADPNGRFEGITLNFLVLTFLALVVVGTINMMSRHPPDNEPPDQPASSPTQTEHIPGLDDNSRNHR
jgi:hypothetical protein